MQIWAKQFYQSQEWRKCRQSYVYKVHGLCERCSSPGKIVHHKIKLTKHNIQDASVTLNHNNLELLCQDCHNREHGMRPAYADGIVFDDEGDVLYIPPGYPSG